MPLPSVGYAAQVSRANLVAPEYTFRYQLPPGLTCDHCVLQVRWGMVGLQTRPGLAGCDKRQAT